MKKEHVDHKSVYAAYKRDDALKKNMLTIWNHQNWEITGLSSHPVRFWLNEAQFQFVISIHVVM